MSFGDWPNRAALHQLNHAHWAEVHENGRPVAAEDARLIALALGELLGDLGRARQLGRAARERALGFTPRRAAGETLAFWRRLRDLPPIAGR